MIGLSARSRFRSPSLVANERRDSIIWNERHAAQFSALADAH